METLRVGIGTWRFWCVLIISEFVVENFTGRIFIGPVLANTNMQFEHG
jgi:hypothetical protein